jgi:hypothetical protein
MEGINLSEWVPGSVRVCSPRIFSPLENPSPSREASIRATLPVRVEVSMARMIIF